MARNNELIRLAKKAATAWRNDSAYWQAAQIIDMLVEELENSTLTQSNEPLTSEQLREMDGKPVLVKLIEPTCGQEQGWTIVYKDNGYAAVQRWTHHPLWYDDYGKTWLAYRRPPDGEK